MTSHKSSKFDGFDRKDIVYSTVFDHNLWASILSPKWLAGSGYNGTNTHTTVPVLVYWHGGGFIAGDRMYEPWWSRWLLEFALSHDAMIIAPDYRLLPEACGLDILDDMDAFWSWFLESLPVLAESESWSVRPDARSILCVGQSAGGSIALHSALDWPDVAIKAIVSLYSPLYPNVPELGMARPRMIAGSWPPPPRQAEAKIRSYIQQTKGTIRTQGNPVEMWDLFACILQQGRLPRMFHRKQNPRLDAIAKVEARRALPPIWIVHGQDDSVVTVLIQNTNFDDIGHAVIRMEHPPTTLVQNYYNSTMRSRRLTGVTPHKNIQIELRFFQRDCSISIMYTHVDEVAGEQQDDVALTKRSLEGFAASALRINPQKLRKHSYKTWLALGGDSLNAVSFMGSCYEAGIEVHIPDIFQSDGLDDILNQIANSHHGRKTSDDINHKSCEDSGNVENGDLSAYGLPEGVLRERLRSGLHGPLSDIQSIGPCSPMQENLLALQRLDPRSYQLRIAARISSTDPAVVVTTEAVKKSWLAVVKRHAALRTTFMENVDCDGQFNQVVWKDNQPQISILPQSEAENNDAVFSSQFPHHLILSEAPDNRVFVKLLVSHTIVDGVSIGVLLRDLFQALTGTLPKHEPLEARSFLHAQQPDTSPEALTYWSHYMAAAEGSFLSSPSSKESPDGLYSVDREIPIQPRLIRKLSEKFNTTLVSVCKVAYALVLRCYTGTDNVCFSYTTSGRQKRIKGLQDAVGSLMNTLPCYVNFSENTTVLEVLNRSQNDFLESLPYQGVNLTIKRGINGRSVRQLSDSLLSFYDGIAEVELDEAGFAVDVVSWNASSDFPYTLMIGLNQDRIDVRFNVWESLISKDDALNMVQLFCDSLEFVLENTGDSWTSFAGLTERDQSMILECSGDAPPIFHSCVHDQVWSMVQQQPEKPAICAWDGEFTYRNLDVSARRIAANLINLGVELETRVGVCMDKSCWVPVAMLAILQAGGVVVPLGNEHPLNRIQTVTRDAAISFILADQQHAKRLGGIAPHIIVIDAPHLDSLPRSTNTDWPDISPDNAGWIVYTSGSTGDPKGVVLEHKVLCSPMHVQAARYGMDQSTRALQFSAHTFDITVKDIFATLSFGGCVCIPSERQRVDNLSLAIRTMGVTFATLTPTVFSLLNPKDVPTLETIVSTGEALKASVVHPWLEAGRVRLFNAYGPSECSHTSTIHGPIRRPKDASVIGFPASNRLWIADPLDVNRLSPVGAVGQLLIEGAIAREYLNDADKTAASFIQDPGFVRTLGLKSGRRMYRTGDLVRQNKDNSLTYLGRRDTQIKINGQRVEVGEVESKVSQLLPDSPPVCVELVTPCDVSGSPILMAAVEMGRTKVEELPGTLCEPSDDLADSLQKLRAHLLNDLPLYMIPSYFIPFTILPTNSSGKLDRRATRAILEHMAQDDLTKFQVTTNGALDLESPWTETEKSLQTIWAELLGRPVAAISRDDHFLQLGGDSVVAMRMVAVARKRNISLSVADIAKHPQLTDLARSIDSFDRASQEATQDDAAPFELWKGFLSASSEVREERLAAVANQCHVPRHHVEDVYPASPLQEGLMAMTSQSPGTYVWQQVFRISSDFDVDRFQRVWKTVAASLAILRTRIVYTSESGSSQVVVRDIAPWSEASSDIFEFLEKVRATSFGYGTPLHRFSIVTHPAQTPGQGDSERYFVWTAHHSAYDGHAVSRILKMVARVWQGGPCDRVTPISRFVQFHGRTSQHEGSDWELAKTYWRGELQGAQLIGFPRTNSPSRRFSTGGVLRHDFEQPQLSGEASRHGSRVSLAILLRAAWALVVASHTGSDEAVIAAVLSGRDAPVVGIEDVVAPTITTVPVRIQIDQHKTIADFLSSIESQSKSMAPFSQFGLANISREVPDLSHDFDAGHLFIVHLDTPSEDATAEYIIGLKSMSGERRNFEGYALVVECMLDANNSGSINVEMRFDESILGPSQAASLMSQLEHVARQLQFYNLPDVAMDSSQVSCTVANLDLISPIDKGKLLYWNKPPPNAVHLTLDGLVASQIAQIPHGLAVCARDGELTYFQLDAAATRLAQYLISLGVGPEILVGLCMEKSAMAIVSMLGILRAGGAVAPIAVTDSDARVDTLLTDAGISIALVDATQVQRFKSKITSPIVANTNLLNRLPVGPTQTHSRASPSSPAWVIFTSGSTGSPKGILLEHHALCSSILAMGDRFGVTCTTRTLQFSAFVFDISIGDVFTTLAHGGCVCMPSESERTDSLAAAMNDLAVTLAVLTPTVASLIDPESISSSFDTLVLVGEAVKPSAVLPWLGRVKVFNGYGPAECSILSVVNGPMRLSDDAPIIGSPLSNRLWVVHPLDHNRLVPIGAPGELLIEGPSLARSYLNDDEKTSKSFVLDPQFAPLLSLPPGRRMYRTGDIVRQDCSTGLLVFIGRQDTQVKIRGQRVDVGEIESLIMRFRPKVQNACVDLVLLSGASNPLLVATVELSAQLTVSDTASTYNSHTDFSDSIPRPSRALNAMLEEIRCNLLELLPLYMVPSHTIPMIHPVNASGKLDRRAVRTILLALNREQLRAFVDEERSMIEERTLSRSEEQLRLLWAEVLGIQVDDIRGANDDFFQLGGDSVAAMRLVAAAQAAPIPMQLGVAQILQNPRLMDMARLSDEYATTISNAMIADPGPFELWGAFEAADTERQNQLLAAVAEECRGLSGPDDIVDVYPSSPLQEGLMAITAQQPGTYIAQQVFQMGADVDVPRLKQTWELIINKLPILRTRIISTTQGSVQVVVNKALEWDFDTNLQSYLKRCESSPFANGTPLHRLAIVQEEARRYFVWTAHHAAYDGWSLLRISRMIVQMYQEGLDSFTVSPITRFVKYLQQTEDAATTYWKEQLKDAQLIPFPPLPSPKYRPRADGFLRTRICGFLQQHNHGRRSEKSRTTPLAILLRSAWAVTVATYTGSTEATINISLSGRDAPVMDIDNIIGTTITTVPVRIKLNSGLSVEHFLASVTQQAKEMVPFVHTGLRQIRSIVPGLGPDFDAGHLFIIQPVPADGDGPGLEAIGLVEDTSILDNAERRDFGGYALAVDCTVDADSADIEMRYDRNVLPQARAESLLSQFEHIVGQLQTHDRGSPMATLDLLSPADVTTIREWNHNTPLAQQACIHWLIQDMVDRIPNRQAVCAWDGEFSYAALHSCARQLALHLASQHGVGPEVTVGLRMKKSRWAVLSILSILIAGGAVVPLGIEQPLSRVSTIARDSQISIILVDQEHAGSLAQLEETSLHLITVDASLVRDLPPPPIGKPVCGDVSPSNAAWIVYTSGSTGVPKGVVLEHKALCSSFRAHGRRVGFGRNTRALQFSAYTFDNSIEDILSVLAYGGCVCVPSEEQRLNALADAIRDLNANLLNTTPTVASLIEPTDVPMLKTLLLGGETVTPSAVERWLGHAKIINTYGPAECCVDISCSAPMKKPSDAYTIGFPLDVCFWVASPSDHNRLVPIGTPGELLVEGPHLGREYLNDPEKTAKGFVWDPEFVSRLGLSSGRRMYRTGDLVWQNSDGSLIHLGRIDTQIKIRGQRVEVGEIESTIIRLQQKVRMACVHVVRPIDTSGEPLLIAAIDVHGFGRDERAGKTELLEQTVCPPTDALNSMLQELRTEMLLVLPRYMVPKFVPMTSLPRNAAGKLDRRATKTILSNLDREQLGAFDRPVESTGDEILTPMEEKLGHLWAELLGYPTHIGTSAHFFHLGGDSVIAMRLVAAAQRMGIRIGVADIIQNPCLSDLAHVAENYSEKRATEQDPAPFALWTGFASAGAEKRKQWLSDIAEPCGISSKDIEDVYPATPLQEILMTATAVQPGAYVAQNVFRVRGVDMTRFKEAWSKLMNFLTILRTRIIYHTASAGSVQVVIRKGLEWIETNDLQAYLLNDKAIPFTYGTPLHRLAVVNQPDHSRYFVWTQHHAGYDGYQTALILHMLAEIYREGVNSQTPPPIPRFIKYLLHMDKERETSYWKQHLEGARLTRFPSVPHPVYFPSAETVSRRRIKRSHIDDRTPISVLLRAAWAITVATYTGDNEATSIIALSGRDVPVVDIGNMVVPTLATVPMRTRLDDRTQLVSDLLAALERQSEDMRPFLHTGMQNIRAAVPGLGADFDPGHLFIVQPTVSDEDKSPLSSIGLEEIPASQSDFSGYALAVQCTIDTDRAVDVEIRYDSGVLQMPMAESLLSQFEHVIHQLETHRGTAIGDLDLLSPADAEKIRSWNHSVLQATPVRYCIHDLVQVMVNKQPHAQAVLSWDGELSYSALYKTACRLSHHLVSLGVGPEVTVGVCIDKSIWAMVSMLAILQSGGVVVALGTQHPRTRINTIIADAAIHVTLVDEAQAERLSGLPHPITVNQSLVDQLPSAESPPHTGVSPDNAAWVIYTSGSTGIPKGVVLDHKALCTGILSHGTAYGNDTRTRALQFASHTFGVAIEDMFTTVIFGGCTCIPQEDQRLNPAELAQSIRRMRVNFINVTTTVACLLDPDDVPGIETVVLGGEALTPAVVGLWRKHAKIFNSYGQSECSVESVIGQIENEQDAAKIGFPIAGSAAWVVDPSNYNRLVPVQVPGQLLFQGPLLARGYLNGAEQDKPSFVSNPDFLARLGFSRDQNDRVYCTGDLVQQNEDGSLVYLGRLDSQIKIRGQRVESGEIESRIIQLHPDIAHAYVDLVHPQDVSQSADPVLMAAVELHSVADISSGSHDNVGGHPPAVRSPTQELVKMIQSIRDTLLRDLPRYMVPSYFVPMAGHLPTNASGKLDRRATHAILHSLTRNQLEAFGRVEKGPHRVLSATEEQLRAAYAEVLGRRPEEIGPDDYFVQLGGDSVTAMHVVAACRRRGMVVSIRNLLQNQSIAALSSYVEMMTKEDNHVLDAGADVVKSFAATDIQQWMLSYHLARPDVGMTYFALDAAESMVGEQMVDACRRLLATVESLHTGFVVENGKWKRVANSSLMRDVQVYTTNTTINEWTESFIQREGSKLIEPGKPLAEIAICSCSKQSGGHRILFRLSHAIWDGMCISNVWSTLRDIYETGHPKKMASFSHYVAQVEKHRTLEARRYWANLLKDSTMTPIGPGPPQSKEYVWHAGIMGPRTIQLGRNLPKGTTYANVLKAAWSLVLAQYARTDNVVFADLVSGRAAVDPSVANTIGCCSTPIPVCIRLDPSSTYADVVYAVQAQQLDSIPFETFGFTQIAQHCTDWPTGTMPTSWINHVPRRIAGGINIGGTEYTISQPKQEEQNWTFSETRVSWLQVDDCLEFTLVYAVERVPERTAQRLYDGLISTIERILTSPLALIESGLLTGENSV
ncbi:hypothetical protein BX600DRAFT_523663 [Xylariales sp. PMI_506]|nr:hypothetical protein BX600DRAFT_523663 [Xylariales sp. PMI_506]